MLLSFEPGEQKFLMDFWGAGGMKDLIFFSKRSFIV